MTPRKKKTPRPPERNAPIVISPETHDMLQHVEKELSSGVPLNNATAPLMELISRSPSLFPELVEALASKSTPWSAQVLKALLLHAPTKEARKQLKRALYRLGQKGISWEESAAQEESIWKPPPAPSTICELSRFYPEGGRLIMMFIPLKHRGYLFMQTALSDREGLLDYYERVIPGLNLFPGVLEAYARKEKAAFIDAEPPHCRFLLEEAREASAKKGATLPPEFLNTMAFVAKKIPKMDVHPFYQLIDMEQVRQDPHLLQEAFHLLGDKKLALGIIDRSVCEPYLQEYIQAVQSPIILTRSQDASRKEDIYRRAVVDIFAREEEKYRVKRRLEETGFVLWKKGFQKEARLCAAMILELESAHSRGILAPNPLLMNLVRHSLEFHASIEKEKVEKAHPLLLKRPWLDEEEEDEEEEEEYLDLEYLDMEDLDLNDD